ncbi:MAG: ribokinase, partial [Oscillospiraceae bacterium]|nr:ribokinase [Oscillospiraceae bacterium]
GSVNYDLVIEVDKTPVIGETVFGRNFFQSGGGKGANQAIACARLGANTSFIGAVGDDAFGAELLSSLKNNNVDVSSVKTVSDRPTGTAMIILHEGDNYIAVDQGANLAVDELQINSADEKISSADMVVLQLEIPLDTVRYVITWCRKHGVPVILNPAPAPKEALDSELLKMVDVLTPNETEAFALTGIMPSTPDEAIKAAMRLTELGANQVAITMGASGCVYGAGADFRHMPTVKVENVVDTTAAGDSFTAALAVSLSEGRNLEQAVEFATRVAAITVTKKGAHPSLPYRKDVVIG